ncbi:prenyltransferase/squalene oxidase repeat-containing protein [Streptomyces sp. NPDC005122]
MADRARSLDGAIAAAVMHSMLTQRDNGSWASGLAARTTETAITCFALARSGDPASRASVARARSWLFWHPVQRGAASMAGKTAAALWSLAVDDGVPIDIGPARSCAAPREEHRLLDIVQLLALHGNRSLHGGKSLKDLRLVVHDAYRSCDPRRPHGCEHVLALAAAVLLDMPLDAGPARQVVERLFALQAPDGSFADDVTTTAISFLALGVGARNTDAWTRCRNHLMTAQSEDGAWRPASADVLETAVTLRAFRADPAFKAHALHTAIAFLYGVQNPDGGWPARSGGTSDSGVTALVLTGMTGLIVPDRVISRAFAFLQHRQNPDGLWASAPLPGVPPCEETVADVLAALRRYPQAHTISAERARTWLRERHSEPFVPAPSHSKGSFPGLPYAAFRTADALGWRDPHTQAGTRPLTLLQNNDGGWPTRPRGTSKPAATGLALAILERSGHLDAEKRTRGIAFLLAAQVQDGRWTSPAQTPQTQPLPALSPILTHAFVALGLHSAQRHLLATV